MPSRNDIQNEITGRQDSVRRNYLKELYKYSKRNTIVYASGFSSRTAFNQQLPGTLFSITLEDTQGFMSAVHELKGDELDIIIHSPGGSAETTEQLVSYLRAKFRHIRAIIPQNAMSAATMLACACDEIVMAKHSALGPIDPQMNIRTANGSSYFIPAQSILDEFEQAKNEVIGNPALATLWVNRINQYPHGFFQQCDRLVVMAKAMVENWLHQYMFKGKTPNDAWKIADWLGNAATHKTHGKPLSIEVLRQQGLKVSELESDQTFQDLVLSVFHAAMVTFETTSCVKLIENQNGKGWFSMVNLQPK